MKISSKMIAPAITTFVIGSAAPPLTQAQLECWDSYVLLTGRCPDPCSHGNDCPCITCTT